MNYTANESVLVGLTGGIATGKSTVIQYLRENGYSVIDADKLGHRVLEPRSYGYQQVVVTFGIEIINPDSLNILSIPSPVFVLMEIISSLPHPINSWI